MELFDEIINIIDQVIASLQDGNQKAKETETAEKTASILAEKNIIQPSSMEEVKKVLMSKTASASDLAELLESNDRSFSAVSVEDSSSNDDSASSELRDWYTG